MVLKKQRSGTLRLCPDSLTSYQRETARAGILGEVLKGEAEATEGMQGREARQRRLRNINKHSRSQSTPEREASSWISHKLNTQVLTESLLKFYSHIFNKTFFCLYLHPALSPSTKMTC